MKGSFIRKAVPPARMGLDGLPVWEGEQRKGSSQEMWNRLARQVLRSYEAMAYWIRVACRSWWRP